MAGAPQTLKALKDLSSLSTICLVFSSPTRLCRLNLIKLFTVTIQRQLLLLHVCYDTVPAQERCTSGSILPFSGGSEEQTDCNSQPSAR